MTLRIITPESAVEESPHAGRVTAIVAEMLTQNPSVILIAWESGGGRVDIRTAPDSISVQMGMSDLVWDITHPKDQESA